MKNLLLWLPIACLVSVPVGLANVQSQQPSRPAQPPSSSAPAQQATDKPRTSNAEFVSYNETTRRITVRDEKGQTSTTTVEGGALKQVANLKKGDKVVLTYRDDAKGIPQAVTDIKLAPKREG